MADLIQRECGVDYHAGHVWKILDELGWSFQRPIGRARERNEEAIRRCVAWSGLGLTKAQTEGRTIVLIDDSGISQRPHRVQTWSRRGQTPILQYDFNWDTLSVVAGLTFFNFYFQLYQGSVRSAEVGIFSRRCCVASPARC